MIFFLLNTLFMEWKVPSPQTHYDQSTLMYGNTITLLCWSHDITRVFMRVIIWFVIIPDHCAKRDVPGWIMLINSCIMFRPYSETSTSGESYGRLQLDGLKRTEHGFVSHFKTIQEGCLCPLFSWALLASTALRTHVGQLY